MHHVIPGFFEISALQDEMTGVSLAGTQLRVNQYNMHDTEWNDVKVSNDNVRAPNYYPFFSIKNTAKSIEIQNLKVEFIIFRILFGSILFLLIFFLTK